MSDKRMLIMPAEVVRKIDDNRGDMSQAEFIDFLIDGQLKEETQVQEYASKEEVYAFKQDIKKLLRSFLDFFVSYGLELGKQSHKAEFEQLSGKLEELEHSLSSEDNVKEAKIKWK